MREVGMVFTAESVQAILAGGKTQTRRILNPQPCKIVADWSWSAEEGEVVIWQGQLCRLTASRGRNKRDAGELTPVRIGPRIEVGDRIYVKETWKQFALGTHGQAPAIYRADYELSDGPGGWRSSRFMPQWAARIWLPVTAVRAEQLQEISEEDAIAEGVDRHNHSAKWPDGDPGYIHDVARRNYSALWNRLHSRDGHGWGANPWVAVYQWEPWRKA